MTLTPYKQAIVKYHAKAEAGAKKGKAPWLPAGKRDVFRVFLKQGALANHSITHRLSKNHQIETFVRKERRDNFNKVALWIVANVDLCTRTFAREATQCQIANRLGLSQATVSRVLTLMIKMDVLSPSFESNDPNHTGVVTDKNGIRFNNIYVVCNDFGYLAGTTAGNKLFTAFADANEEAVKETGEDIKERILTVRDTVWQATTERRTDKLNDSTLRKTISKITDRFRASKIIFKRMLKRGELQHLNEEAIERTINRRLKYYGFSA